VAPVLLAVMLIVNFGPDTTGQTLRSKKVNGVAEVFVTKPSADERASIFVVFLNAWSPEQFRLDIEDLGDRRPIASKKMRESVNEKKVQKRYEEEFKRQALELVIHSGKTQAQIARELGVSEYL
jgi:uncharacterized protein YihD (DUF1040 family)